VSISLAHVVNHGFFYNVMHPIAESVTSMGAWAWLGIGAAAGLSGAMNYIEYKTKKSELLELYQDEIASKLGKSVEKTTVKDLETLAYGSPERGIPANGILAEELKKQKEDANLGIAVTLISVFATVLVLGLVSAALSSGGVLAAGASLLGHSTLPLLSWGGAGQALVKGLIGFSCHKLLEQPVKMAGESLFGIEGLSTHERIEELINDRAAGKNLSKEQVLGVFLSANKELQEFVKQQFGEEYDKLTMPIKQKIVETFEQFVPIGQVTESLNSGRVRITELAFSAEGQSSGILPSEKPVPRQLNAIGKTRGWAQNISVAANNVATRWQQRKMQTQPAYQAYSPPIATKPSEPLRPLRKEVFYDNPERSDGNKWANVVRGQAVSKAPEQSQPQPIDYNPAYAGR